MGSSDALECCSIDRWYDALRADTIRTVIIPLPAGFVEYLLSDGVVLPDDDADAEGFSGSDEDASDGSGEVAPRFPEVEAAITSAIRRCGGACFPKLNWSAPSDAAWVLGGSLKCVNLRDVLLLLKSSDRVAHDLCYDRQAHETSNAAGAMSTSTSSSFRWVLALRRWCNLRPAGEFRCFGSAHGAVLLAACQRDRFTHYPFLETSKARVLVLLQQFARARTLGRATLPARIVWDVYVDAEEKVHLVDVSPWEEATDPLLFEWDELNAAAARVDTNGDGSAEAPSQLTSQQAFTSAFGVVPPDVHVRAKLVAASSSTVCIVLHAGRPQSSSTGNGRDGGHHASIMRSSPLTSRGGCTASCELRLVPKHGVAPSAQIYYGWPEEIRTASSGDVGSLLDAARAAASVSGGGEDTGACATGSPTGSEELC